MGPEAEYLWGFIYISILVGATLAGFALLAIGIGWVKSGVAQVRTGLRAGIIAVDGRLSAFETQVTERLTRIETLLEERLPERRKWLQLRHRYHVILPQRGARQPATSIIFRTSGRPGGHHKYGSPWQLSEYRTFLECCANRLGFSGLAPRPG